MKISLAVASLISVGAMKLNLEKTMALGQESCQLGQVCSSGTLAQTSSPAVNINQLAQKKAELEMVPASLAQVDAEYTDIYDEPLLETYDSSVIPLADSSMPTYDILDTPVYDSFDYDSSLVDPLASSSLMEPAPLTIEIILETPAGCGGDCTDSNCTMAEDSALGEGESGEEDDYEYEPLEVEDLSDPSAADLTVADLTEADLTDPTEVDATA